MDLHSFPRGRATMMRSNGAKGFAAIVLAIIGQQSLAAEMKETPQIIVDQFGWRPGDVKVAVFADPQRGQNAADRLVPGREFEVRSASATGEGDREVVFRGTLKPWKGGQTDEISGDRAWWADFSKLKTPGRYVLR